MVLSQASEKVSSVHSIANSMKASFHLYCLIVYVATLSSKDGQRYGPWRDYEHDAFKQVSLIARCLGLCTYLLLREYSLVSCISQTGCNH